MNAGWKGGGEGTGRWVPGRRRVFGLILATLAAGWTLPLSARGSRSRLLSLHEADFYRPHDHAG